MDHCKILSDNYFKELRSQSKKNSLDIFDKRAEFMTFNTQYGFCMQFVRDSDREVERGGRYHSNTGKRESGLTLITLN